MSWSFVFFSDFARVPHSYFFASFAPGFAGAAAAAAFAILDLRTPTARPCLKWDLVRCPLTGCPSACLMPL